MSRIWHQTLRTWPPISGYCPYHWTGTGNHPAGHDNRLQGDSHTSTHGAFGTIAFGIGTSEVEEVLTTQCLLQNKPKTMRIEINGKLSSGVVAKDIILYIISKLTSFGATGYFIEYAGSTISSLSMEGRMTICNMSIEMGARGGMIAPDEITYKYMKGREFMPKGKDFEKAKKYWKNLTKRPRSQI